MAPQFEQELPLLEALLRILERYPHPPIPHDHRTGAVLALGNDTLELRILERMVLGLHREAFVGLVR